MRRLLPGSPPPLAGAPPDPALRAFAAGEPLTGFVAALRAQKDPLALVAAAASLIAAGRLPGKVAIVGNGPMKDDVEQAIARAGIGDRVRLFAFAGESEPYLRALDLVVLPSLWEAYPLVLLEAFACGTPVLATAVGGVPEMLEAGRAGGLVAPGDPPALAAALVSALHDAQARAAWARAGSERLAAHHGVEHMLAAAEAIYADMLGAAPPRGADAR
jgi:glycosyltransferase involved in cell wall biosynthesis